ncbi:MAG: hypothetical protein GY720_07160 [bacterium]|nr:hypothetical protein [bacterium]
METTTTVGQVAPPTEPAVIESSTTAGLVAPVTTVAPGGSITGTTIAAAADPGGGLSFGWLILIGLLILLLLIYLWWRGIFLAGDDPKKKRKKKPGWKYKRFPPRGPEDIRTEEEQERLEREHGGPEEPQGGTETGPPGPSVATGGSDGGGTVPPGVPVPPGRTPPPDPVCEHKLTITGETSGDPEFGTPFSIDRQWFAKVEEALNRIQDIGTDTFHSDNFQEGLRELDKPQRDLAVAGFTGFVPGRSGLSGDADANDVAAKAAAAVNQLKSIQPIELVLKRDKRFPRGWRESKLSVNLFPCHPPDVAGKVTISVVDAITSRRQDDTGKTAHVTLDGQVIEVEPKNPTSVPKTGKKDLTWGAGCSIDGTIDPTRAYGSVTITATYQCQHLVTHTATTTWAANGVWEDELRDAAREIHSDNASLISASGSMTDVITGVLDMINEMIDSIGGSAGSVGDLLPSVANIAPVVAGLSFELLENAIGLTNSACGTWMKAQLKLAAAKNDEALALNLQEAEAAPEDGSGSPGAREKMHRKN